MTEVLGRHDTWTGSTGVGIGNFFTARAVRARFGDFNLLISNQLTDDSQILFRRAITERVPAIAPFLRYDGDPYLVSADDRLLWVWDAYTVTSAIRTRSRCGRESICGTELHPQQRQGRDRRLRRRREVLHQRDPTTRSSPRTRASFLSSSSRARRCRTSSVAHLRYPEDLFLAQNRSYLLYHLPATDAVPRRLLQPGRPMGDPEDESSGPDAPMEPYYVIMRIPGEDKAEFVLIQPPFPGAAQHDRLGRGRMDPGHYGEKIAFTFPRGRRRTARAGRGPYRQDDAVSEQFTAVVERGSSVQRGNLLVLPIGEDGLLYVEPIFLRAEGAPFPEFVRVIMVDQERSPSPRPSRTGSPSCSGRPSRRRRGAVTVAGRVSLAGRVPLAGRQSVAGRVSRRHRRARGGGAAPLRPSAASARRRRPRDVPGPHRPARRGAQPPCELTGE
jgi:hypothetical protein